MNHNINAWQSANAAARSCGGCGAGYDEKHDPECPRIPKPRKTWRKRIIEALGFTAGVALASSAAMGGMTLLGMWHW